MTNKSRYFLLGASAALVAGLGGGIFAYYTYSRVQAVPAGLPAELRYVPANVELVAYADVQAVMSSELRRELERAAEGSGRDRRQVDDFAGIDLEKQVNRVVAYVEPMGSGADGPPRGLLLAQGSFDQKRIEQFIRDHSGTIGDHNGKRIAIYRRPENDDRGQRDDGRQEEVAIGFVQPDLIALGQGDLVRRALDFSGSAASNSASVMSNAELMSLIRDTAGETAWVVGHFDAVSRRLGIPSSLSGQVPPLRMIAARAHINGGLKATIRAQTADQAAADQIRDVIRGFVSLARLQAAAKPELQNTLKSLELGGTGSTVQLSFAMTPETLRSIVPQRRPSMKQFSGFEALPGLFVNGASTLGENIGDLGGLNMAYNAYRISLNGKEPPVIDGLTGDQRFFLSWAQVWRAKYRDGVMREQLLSDVHSPAYFRVNGAVRNMEAWYRAFDVKPGDKLYLAPEDRVSIW